MGRQGFWQPAAVVVLLVLLAALGTLQYRWLGDVSQAERERMRSSLQTRVSDFSEAFDRELTRIYMAFHVAAVPGDATLARALTDAFTQWQQAAAVPDLVDAVYVLEAADPDHIALSQLDSARGTLSRIEWPPSLEKWRLRLMLMPQWMKGAGPLPMLPPEPVDASIPAIIVAQPVVTRLDDGRRMAVVATMPGLPARFVMAALNADRLQRKLLEPLVARYFGSGAASEYFVTIVRRDDPSHIVYSSDPRTIVDEKSAGAKSGLFDLQMDELARLNAPAMVHRESSTRTTNMAITIVRRGPDAARLTIGRRPDENTENAENAGGGWQARARFRSGSLESIVAQSRRRNLAIAVGVLGLLAASFALIVVSSARRQRLARQQIEFVAAVSHELRTPLAVIRSAGENLADGVVAEHDQVKKYGSLIEAEGRRLTDMVERVMAFAGIASGAPERGRAEVDLSRVLQDAVASARAEGRDRGVDVAVAADGFVPAVTGDAQALRSAFENVLGNAVKYSRGGERVEVGVSAVGERVRVTVADRGIGIDADDLPHIFQPFFRSRRAVDAQIRGTGIGLSVVRHVVEAHDGILRVDSRPGEGTTVTIELPIAS